MFTGIVQGVGTVVEVIEKQTIHTLRIEIPDTNDLAIGASVSIDGACLTAVKIQDSVVDFDVIPETLHRTTLAHLSSDSKVNVERSLKFGDEIGGHLLSGHIMGTGIIHSKIENGEGVDFQISIPVDLRR